jgi:hypothetical protein
MTTIKQQKAVHKMVENGGNVSKAMISAGYSAATAKTPGKLTNSKGFKEEVGALINGLKVIRWGVIQELASRDLSQESPMSLVRMNDTLTKNIELLSGGFTEREDITISWKY